MYLCYRVLERFRKYKNSSKPSDLHEEHHKGYRIYKRIIRLYSDRTEWDLNVGCSKKINKNIIFFFFVL